MALTDIAGKLARTQWQAKIDNQVSTIEKVVNKVADVVTMPIPSPPEPITWIGSGPSYKGQLSKTLAADKITLSIDRIGNNGKITTESITVSRGEVLILKA